jgi:hypothetical protein
MPDPQRSTNSRQEAKPSASCLSTSIAKIPEAPQANPRFIVGHLWNHVAISNKSDDAKRCQSERSGFLSFRLTGSSRKPESMYSKIMLRTPLHHIARCHLTTIPA